MADVGASSRSASHPTTDGFSALAAQTDPQRPFQAGRWYVDPAAREATDGIRTRRLSPRAMQVLLYLANVQGAVASRAELLNAVWPNVHVGDENLTQAVTELRRALDQPKDGERLVETVPKAGYRLKAPVITNVVSHGPLAIGMGPGIGQAEPQLPLDAHIAMTEARRLARFHGVPAVAEIDRLIREAAAMAPHAASVQAEYAVLMGLAAVHVGDRHARLAAASEAAETAVRLRPDLVAPHRALGFVAGIQRRMDHALKSFSCALTIDPDDFETHYLAAQVCFGNGDLLKSAILGERAAELDQDDYRPAYNAARAALHLGDARRAGRLARMALIRIDARLTVEPGTRRFLSARAAASAMLGHASEAVDATLKRAADGGLFYDVVALAHQGEIGPACALLEDLVDRGWTEPSWIYADPVHDLLLRERRFSRVIERMEAA